MPRLRRLSGDGVVRILQGFGFEIVGQRGSHLKLARAVDGMRQVLVVPRHRELDPGTCRAIMRQAGRYVPENDLRRSFYAE